MCGRTLSPKVKVPLAKIKKFCRDHHVVKFSLCGSVLTDSFNKKSDVDILVEFDPDHIPSFFGLADMQFELEKFFNRSVDLRTPNDLSIYFREKVISNALRLV
jgi:predicted nucleotidyltransferase